MQNSNNIDKKIENIPIKSSRISRISTNSGPANNISVLPIEEPKKNSNTSTTSFNVKNSLKMFSNITDKVFDFLKSEDALLIFLVVVLLQDEIEDELLILVLLYLLFSGK